MCGIVGYINCVARFNLDTITHRGPDSKGVYSDKYVKFGHTRLSIQDLSQFANQPFISRCGNYVLIFNGEIYNHLELRKKLIDFNFETSSDTETVLNMLIKYGKEALETFNGIFALALYNIREGVVLIARDRFGVKPLYYGESKNTLVFGSELKSLLNWEHLRSDDLDIEAFENYIRYLYSPGEHTPFKSIKKLVPGSVITVQLNKGEIVTNESSFIVTRNRILNRCTEEDYIERLSALLEAAVQRQLLSDVPVGFFLSGGLDSSLLVAIARKLRPSEKIQCYTIDSSEFSATEGFKDDMYYAKRVAEFLNVELEIVPLTSEVLDSFDDLVWFLDEPQADAAPLNLLSISKRAREMGFKVLIGGTAGDDLFSGYRRHRIFQTIQHTSIIPNWVFYKIFQIIPTKNKSIRRLKKLTRSLAETGANKIYSLYEWLPFETSRNLFIDKDVNRKRFEYFEHVTGKKQLKNFTLSDMLKIEKRAFLVDHNLNYTDKLGMAAGVEIRVPYLDNDLEEFSCEIPDDLKLKSGETKYILKKVAEKYLPRDVIYREKSGFGAPVRKWITEDLSERINQELSSNLLETQGIFDYRAIQQLIERNKSYEIDASYSLWALLSIQSWIKQFGKQNEANHTKSE